MSDEEKPVLLVNLVIARLKEEWPDHSVGTSYYEYPSERYHNFFIDHIVLGEVYATKVRMRIPHLDQYQIEEVVCEAADPKFFQRVCATVKLVMQRHIDAAEDGLRGAQYFR
jgi:hypothetical protein